MWATHRVMKAACCNLAAKLQSWHIEKKPRKSHDSECPFIAFAEENYSFEQSLPWSASVVGVWSRWSGLLTSGRIPFSWTSQDRCFGDMGLFTAGLGESAWRKFLFVFLGLELIIAVSLLDELIRFDASAMSDSPLLLLLRRSDLVRSNNPDQRFRMSGFATHCNKKMERPCRLTATVNKYWTGRDALSNMNRPVIQVKPRRVANVIDRTSARFFADFSVFSIAPRLPASDTEIFTVLWER